MTRLAGPVPLAALAAAVALVALLGYGLTQHAPRRGIDTALAAGERPVAPKLALSRLDRPGEATLADWRGSVVILNYWASWCVPCREETPLLERWQRRIAGKGGTVLGVDALDVTGDARSFMRRYGLTYPMLRDRDGSSQYAFGVAGYPETFVIDRRGRIAALRRGPVDERFLRAHVLPLLREKS